MSLNLPKRVHGSWFMVRGPERTINYQPFDSSQGEPSAIDCFKSGFSLIELLIVITLFTITSIMVTTSYVAFEGRERLKNGALQLKSDLRFVQNKAQTGDKVSNDVSGCQTTVAGTPPTQTNKSLGGWYLDLTSSAGGYSVSGVCVAKSGIAPNYTYTPTLFGSKQFTLPDGVTITSIKYSTPSVETTITHGYVYFKPGDYSVYFYRYGTTLPDIDPSGLNNSFVDTTTGFLRPNLTDATPGDDVMTIRVNSSDGDYDVTINRSGEIYETKI